MYRFAGIITMIFLACCVAFVFRFLNFSTTKSDHPLTTAFKAEAPRKALSTLNQQESAGPTSSSPHNLYNLSTPASYNPYGCYEQIGNGVVLSGTSTTLPEADVETFQDMSEFDLCFGKDKKSVYYYDQVIPWANPSTFSVLWYARGPVMFFQNGNELISWNPLGDYSTQLNPSCPPTPSGGFCIVPGGDPNTFQTMAGAYDIAPWAKDKHNVYCGGVIVQGADPSTSQLVDDNRELRVVANGMPITYVGCAVVGSTTSI